MVRILAAGCIHGDVQLTEKLAKKAILNQVDLVVIAGDLTISNLVSPGLMHPFNELGVKVLIIPGNHDSFEALYNLELMYENVKSLHDNHHFHDHVGFFGTHGTQLGPIGSSDSEIENILTRNHEVIKDFKKKVMVVHEPPYGTKLDNIGHSIGNKGVRSAIESINPDLVICGHVHETFGEEDFINNTRIINAGREGVILDL